MTVRMVFVFWLGAICKLYSPMKPQLHYRAFQRISKYGYRLVMYHAATLITNSEMAIAR